jgi:hypothetical protein
MTKTKYCLFVRNNYFFVNELPEGAFTDKYDMVLQDPEGIEVTATGLLKFTATVFDKRSEFNGRKMIFMVKEFKYIMDA